ncbi:MAG: hypothetical protein Q7T97_02545 [Burkholderiaceae bacterium]|nr:hypothetical protein [Burkholderiaceae bacterium]
MSTEQIMISLLGVVCTALGWFLNEMYRAVEKLKDDMSELEIKIGTDFVRYDRLQDMLKPIHQGIEEIKSWITGGKKP